MTERGYQGEFQRVLANLLIESEIFPNEVLVEEEYQKRLREHGIRFRPDIIIHIPIEVSDTINRRLNNFCVFEFKLNASKEDAFEDFQKLEQMFTNLDYPEGYFINIQGYQNSFLKDFESLNKERINEVSLIVNERTVYIRHDFYDGGKIKTKAMCLNI
jgi:hypothetical protein